MKALRLFFLFVGGSVPAQQSAADGVFHLGGDTPFYLNNTESESIWIQNL